VSESRVPLDRHREHLAVLQFNHQCSRRDTDVLGSGHAALSKRRPSACPWVLLLPLRHQMDPVIRAGSRTRDFLPRRFAARNVREGSRHGARPSRRNTSTASLLPPAPLGVRKRLVRWPSDYAASPVVGAGARGGNTTTRRPDELVPAATARQAVRGRSQPHEHTCCCSGRSAVGRVRLPRPAPPRLLRRRKNQTYSSIWWPSGSRMLNERAVSPKGVSPWASASRRAATRSSSEVPTSKAMW
jgi:hypothetical protein